LKKEDKTPTAEISCYVIASCMCNEDDSLYEPYRLRLVAFFVFVHCTSLHLMNFVN